MSQNPKCTEKSDLHKGEKTTLTLQRVLDSLKKELQNEPAETEATTLFKADLTFMETEYNGIPEIVNAYEMAHKDFIGTMKSEAQQQWESVVNWSDDKVPDNMAKAITALREGEFYAKQGKKLESELLNAEEAYYSLKECYKYFEAKEKKAIEELEQAKSYGKKVGDCFAELKKLYEAANGFKDAGKHRSVFAVRLEFNDIRMKTLPAKDSGSLADPETFKKNLTEKLRKVIAFKHERFLWHKAYLVDQDDAQKDLLAKQSAFEKAKQNYEDHLKDIRDRFIREAEDIQPAADSANPPTVSAQKSPEPEIPAADKTQKTSEKK